MPSAQMTELYRASKSKKKSKKMTLAEKYESLKKQTERAGMTVTEKDGKLVVSRKRKK
jgi:hypothetical protein